MNRTRLSFYDDHAREIHERDGATDTCPVCGDLCAVKMVNELFGTGKKKCVAEKKAHKRD